MVAVAGRHGDADAHRKARRELRVANNRLRLRGEDVPQTEWERLEKRLKLGVDDRSPVTFYEADLREIDDLVTAYVDAGIRAVKALGVATTAPREEKAPWWKRLLGL